MNHSNHPHPNHPGFPQHQGYDHPTMVSHVPENETLGYKRSRDVSPSSVASMQPSFKRMKIMPTSTMSDHISSSPSSPSSSSSWHHQHHAPEPQNMSVPPPTTQCFASQHRTVTAEQTHFIEPEKQFAGQHSSKAAQHANHSTQQQQQQQQQHNENQNANYQSMNSLLGSLHMMRRRQQHRSGEAASHSQQQQQQQQQEQYQPSLKRPPSAHSTNGQHAPRKKVANLRISSNLY